VVLYSESSTGRTGNLGGRSGADALCSASLNRPTGLVQVHAFLSVSAGDQIADFTTKYGVPSGLAIESPTGAVLARNFTGLLGGSILQSLRDAGVFSRAVSVWSGSETNGVAAAETCSGWTSASTSGFGRIGASAFAFQVWINNAQTPCDSAFFLMCIAY
jgi:hypothetical protein